MAKQSGLGDNLYYNGYDISGDVGSIQRVAMPMGQLDDTGIDKFANERLYGKDDGVIDYTAFWNTTALASFDALKAELNTGVDRHVMYCRGTTIGSPAACLVAKRSNLTWTRPEDGGISAALTAEANAFGLDWGELLTAGKRTDSTATNGASLDGGAATAFGLQAYVQFFAFTGTSVTVTLQDSADNSAWANITSAAFTAATAGQTAQRLATGRTDAVRRYVRAITSGTFTNAVFAVQFTRNNVSRLI